MDRIALCLATADYIEKNPNLYKFSADHVPEFGQPGCVIAIAGMLAGRQPGERSDIACPALFGMTECQFLREMGNIAYDFADHPAIAVKVLRAFANQSHIEK